MDACRAGLSGMVVRALGKSEYEEYRAVWNEEFGDGPEFVDELYSAMEAASYGAEDGGVLHSFLTVFEVGKFHGRSVMVSYAVCTRPESRGRGYGSELVKQVRDMIVQAGAISLVCPAEAGLEKFYAGLGYAPAFYASDNTAEAEDLNIKLSILSAAEYNRFREAFLSDVPHVECNARLMEFARNDSVNAQGLLLINNGDAICTLNYGSDDEIGISELIVNPVLAALNDEIAWQLAGGLAHIFEVPQAHFRSVGKIVYTDDSGDRLADGCYVQGMLSGMDVDVHEAAVLPYYGFPID